MVESESKSNLRIEPLSSSHDRGSFSCGEKTLDGFLQEQAGQAQKKGLSRTFVATEGTSAIIGYYTLASMGVTFEAFPFALVKRLKGYSHPIPVVHLGRLAIATPHQGKGLGSLLLIDALSRAKLIADNLGMFAVDVVALNDQAKKFYMHHEFVPMVDRPNHLFIPMQTVRSLFDNER